MSLKSQQVVKNSQLCNTPMLSREEHIAHLSQLGEKMRAYAIKVPPSVIRTSVENPWLDQTHYTKALHYWAEALTSENLKSFVKPYHFRPNGTKVGIIMAGNIPLVGFHDLLSVILSGKIAVCKVSSDDAYVIPQLIEDLYAINPAYQLQILLVDKVKQVDAVIATGSNNSFRYFEYYFRDIPSVLRKNRKSMAVLGESTSEEDLKLLAEDIFTYYGLGCRNVSLVFKPKNLPIEQVIDNFSAYQHYLDHNKYANNYTYQKAIALMNGENHWDAGYVLVKQERSLNAPIACINICNYSDIEQVQAFITDHSSDIQCISTSLDLPQAVELGKTQTPALSDFADNVDTMKFLENLTQEA
jgi:hypothetical protein